MNLAEEPFADDDGLEPEPVWQGHVADINRNFGRALAIGAACIFGVLVIGFGLLFTINRATTNTDKIDSLEENQNELTETQDRLATGVDELRDQVKQLGGTPVVPPADELVEDGEANVAEIQEEERQEAERQEAERQERELQEAELQEDEVNDPDPFDDPDPVDDPGDEVNDPDPVDDPDPNDPDPDDPDPDDPDSGGITAIDIVSINSNECLIRIILADGTTIDSDPFDCPGGNNE
jgi:hypothetical protein